MPPKKPDPTPRLIAALLKGGDEVFKPQLLTGAHFMEHQQIHPSLDWAGAAALLQRTFPRETRLERPQSWYRTLAATHWPATERGPGPVPPGNGPFYVPDWVFQDLAEDEQKRLQAGLKAAGFKPVVAHVGYLPENNDYLVAAMRLAGKHRWTVNPTTYRVYVYPSLGIARPKRYPLRDYTTERWRA